MDEAHTSFSKEAFAAFRADDRPRSVRMLNLVRLREAVRKAPRILLTKT